MITQNLLKPPRDVLIIEDSFDVRAMLKEILRTQNITSVDEADELNTAIRKLDKFNYKLVFLDINLKEKNGLEVLKEIRQSNIKLPVIVISGHNTTENVRTAIVQGASGFVVKPFSPQKIVSFIDDYL